MTAPSTAWSELTLDRRLALAVDGVEPRFHARPSSPEELAEALGAASTAKLAVGPRGGGTRLALGNLPSRLDLVLETTALDQVVEYEPADLTITVQAGMRFQALQELLRAQGQFLPLDPPVEPGSTIGGIIATNASGPLRFGYGTARDIVIGTRIANSDGKLTRAGGRVVKNVAGYDLNKLYVGSLGTVGVIVELGFKLSPLPPSEATVALQFAELAAAGKLVEVLVRSQLQPLAIELLGQTASREMGLSSSGSAVVVRVGGYEKAVDRQVRELEALAARHGGRRVEATVDLWRRLAALGGPSGRPVLLKAAVPLARTVTAMQQLESELGNLHPLTWAHAGNGIVQCALEVAEGLDLTGTVARLRSALRTLGDNASLIVERCPAELKQGLDAWGNAGDGLPLMRAIKTKLDPQGTLNPGRYVGGI